MEAIIYQDIVDKLDVFIRCLCKKYNIPESEAINIIKPDGRWNEIYHSCRTCNNKNTGRPQCTARVWNHGYGARCSARSTQGSEFCLKHCQLKFPTLCQGCVNYFKENRYHDYVWQHLGRYNEPLPKFFKSHDD